MKIIDNLLTIGKYSRPGDTLDRMIAVVVHWTASPGQGTNQVRDYYENDEAAKEHYGSAHYCVGLQGEIVRMIPEVEMAYHVGSALQDPASGRIYTDLARATFPGYCTGKKTPNFVTLGIEMCVPDEGVPVAKHTGAFNRATIEAAAELASYLLDRHRSHILLRHYDVVGWKDCPRGFVKNPDAWAAFRKLVL